MKTIYRVLKVMILFSLALCLLLPLGCANKTPDNTGADETESREANASEPAETQAQPLKAVSVLDIETSGSYDGGFGGHVFDVTRLVEKSFDGKKANDTKTVEFAGQSYELKYEMTYTYKLGNYSTDLYKIVGSDDDYFMFTPEGAVQRVVKKEMDAARTQIDVHADGETARAAVEDALKDEIDFAGFEYCDIIESKLAGPDGFSTYTFIWYNRKGDIMTAEKAKAVLRQDGGIGSVVLPDDRGLDSVPDDISINDYIPAIEEKLQKIYGEKLAGYTFLFEPELTNIGGTPCIYCELDVEYYEDDEHTDKSGEICDLAVMLGR